MVQKIKNFIKHTPFYALARNVLDFIEAQKWEKGGGCGRPPYLIKQKIIKEYANRFNIDTFIETGTYLGKTVSAAKNIFSEIFSIELDNKLFEKARERFMRYPYIHIIHGDSGKILPVILVSLKKPCLFWLDAHYSGGITARGEIDTPITEELRAILSHPVSGHVILIDDAHHFSGVNGYPTIEWLKDYVLKHGPNRNFELEHNIIRIFPKNQ